MYYRVMIKLYNTLSKKKQVFRPLKDKEVRFYSCGPTVYNYAHIGNLRTYIFNDILKRVLRYNGLKVKHVMNLTDVGHLTSDADTGEDKLEKAAEREQKTAWQIAEFYTESFKKDLKKLNIEEPDIWAKATDHIEEQIKVIKILERKGFTYRIEDGIYFDSSKIKDYGKLEGKKKKNIMAGARVEMAEGKKNPQDFALWKFSPKDKKRQMEWNSPWGIGFPGWHTECVAMSKKHLGVPFDIHTGGIDHIAVHHTNEIAQTEAAFEKDLAMLWLHGEFLDLKKEKMAKSEGNVILLGDIIRKGFDPLSFRYLCLTAHYRSKLTFSWKALESAQKSLENLRERIFGLKDKGEEKKKEFLKYINDDLDMPKALAFVWKIVKEEKATQELLFDFDRVFGLGLNKIKEVEIPEEIIEMVKQREKFRKKSEWEKADLIRKEIERKGYAVEDTAKGSSVIKKISPRAV